MDYKKLIKSRAVRLAILNCLSFVPDKPMLQLQYRIKTGRKLNLKNPRRYTEKLQWYKLYYKDPRMVQCVDKYDVREYVESKGLGHILNTCYGVFDRVEDIDFDLLPEQFVLKDTLGSGGNSVILVKSKKNMDLAAVKAQLRKWVNENHRIRSGGREWPYYSGKKHRILIEKYLAKPDGDLPDYKFFCFNGRVEYIYFMRNYTENHANGELGFFDRNFQLVPAYRTDFHPILEQPNKPEQFGKMLQIAETLSSDFPHVRVDFFNLHGEIVFGELTYTMASGYMLFEPDEFDYTLGNCFELPFSSEKTDSGSISNN